MNERHIMGHGHCPATTAARAKPKAARRWAGWALGAAGPARVAFLLACMLTGFGTASLAQGPACAGLSAEKKSLVQSLFARLHPYDGCDDTFARCLAQRSPSKVVARLAEDICRQAKAGKDGKQIEHALAKRAQSMLPGGRRLAAQLDEATRAGAADAPVVLVAYACTRCPLCKEIIPALHAAVHDGPLAGKVRLYVRPFPLKNHPGASEGGLAILAAAKLGGFWPFTLLLYQRFDAFTPAILPAWAEQAGLDRVAFERILADPATRAELVAAKQEGLRNKVAATPSLFIDGRAYVYDVKLEPILDVLQEAYDATRVGKN
jgi:protein-disulfide isomerase